MSGILNIIGVGPGEPELLTLKAYHVLTAVQSAWMIYTASRGWRNAHDKVKETFESWMNESGNTALSLPLFVTALKPS